MCIRLRVLTCALLFAAGLTAYLLVGDRTNRPIASTIGEAEPRIGSAVEAPRALVDSIEQEAIQSQEVSRLEEPPDSSVSVPSTSALLIFFSAVQRDLPVRGVRVFQDDQPIGESLADGTCLVRSAPGVEPGVIAVASASGYETSSVRIGWSSESIARQSVFLEPAASISGWVRWADGAAAPPNTVVIAWPDARIPDPAVLRRVLAGSIVPWLHKSSVAATGEFELGALSRRVRYRLLAFGPGLIADEEPPLLASYLDSPVTLRAMGLYGAVVRLRGQGGSEVPVSPRLLGSGPSWSGSAGTARCFLPVPWQAALLESCIPRLSELSDLGPGSWRSSLLLFASPSPVRQALGPVDYHVTVPGCIPLEAQITLAWLGTGLTEQVLTVHPVADCFGALQVVPAISPGPAVSLPGSLFMKSMDDKSAYIAAVDLAEPQSLTIVGVPCGRYEVQFRARDTYFQWPLPGEPLPEIQVTAGAAPVSIEVDVRSAGVLEIELVDEAGANYAGWWYASLESGPAWAVTSKGADMLEPPYRLGLVEPGSWRIRVKEISSNFEILERTTPLTVQAGQVARCAIPLRNRRPAQ